MTHTDRAPLRFANYSLGVGSFLAAWRATQRHGIEGVRLVFADVLMEWPDAYRFGIEGAALLRGLQIADVADLAAAARALPPLDRMAERKLALAELRAATMARIPGFAWLADGRTTFEAMRAARFLGNSRLCPGAKFLKHRVIDAYLAAEGDPARDAVIVGLDWSEDHRVERFALAMQKRGGWRVEAPMTEAPYLTKDGMIAELGALGLQPSDSYAAGLAHDNCSGLCVRAGKAHFAQVRALRPEVFAYGIEQEEELRALLGEVAIIHESGGRGQPKRPLPLASFAARLDAQGLAEQDAFDFGGCGCGTDREE